MQTIGFFIVDTIVAKWLTYDCWAELNTLPGGWTFEQECEMGKAGSTVRFGIVRISKRAREIKSETLLIGVVVAKRGEEDHINSIGLAVCVWIVRGNVEIRNTEYATSPCEKARFKLFSINREQVFWEIYRKSKYFLTVSAMFYAGFSI